MDPISTSAVSAVISGLLKPATDEASKRLVDAMRALARRIPGMKGEPSTEVEPTVLAGELVSAAEEDPELAHDLAVWIQEAQTVIDAGTVSNSNTGQVDGPLIQGRDFSGPITFK